MKPSKIAEFWLEGIDRHNAEDHRPYDDLSRAYLRLREAALDYFRSNMPEHGKALESALEETDD